MQRIKKLLISFIIIVIALFAMNVKVAFADVGDFDSYDSGGSWDSGSSWDSRK